VAGVSLIWMAPVGVGVVAAVALTVASLRVVRRAEELRASMARLGDLAAGGRNLRDEVGGLGATLEELGRR
jgi:hypothetical protein